MKMKAHTNVLCVCRVFCNRVTEVSHILMLYFVYQIKKKGVDIMAKAFNKNNFNEDVLKSDVPVMVDFWASWCGTS